MPLPEMHGRTHCPTGSDPIPAECLSSGSVEVLYLSAWNYDTVNTLATATWTSVCALGGSDGFFEDSWKTSGYGQSFSFDTGVATLGAYHYHVEGWVQFNENANAGEQRFVALNFGSGDRRIQEYVAVAGSVAHLALKLPVHSPYITSGSGNVFIEAYHDHGSDLTVRDAELVIRRFSSYASGTFEARP